MKYRELTYFICVDDKHRLKVGEPGFSVAAAERGREVIVSLRQTFAVVDHDFTRFSVVPSVVFHVAVPKSFEGSWYTGNVSVGLKDAVFQASSPIRHATDFYHELITKLGTKSILCVYSDGGPDHRLNNLSVQLSLIALFLNLNLDFLIACRTAPNHSWRNPVERLMSIINLGFQSVDLMPAKGSDEFESKIHNCNTLKELRNACCTHRSEVSKSIEPVIELLSSIVKRLELKGQPFETYEAAKDDDVEAFWEIVQTIDASLTPSGTTKKSIKDEVNFLEFVKHCCRVSHYSFHVKKCGKLDCTICKPVRMDLDVFNSLSFLPNPVPDDHYKPFNDVYGQEEPNEKHRPSLQLRKKKASSFSTSQQHVKNIGVLVQCEECDKWRLLFCKHKLTHQEVTDLQSILEDVSYSCGTAFEDVEMSGRLSNVFVDHDCTDGIEKLYYSCGFEAICVYCASEDLEDTHRDSPFLPQCQECTQSHKQRIRKPKAKS